MNFTNTLACHQLIANSAASPTAFDPEEYITCGVYGSINGISDFSEVVRSLRPVPQTYKTLQDREVRMSLISNKILDGFDESGFDVNNIETDDLKNFVLTRHSLERKTDPYPLRT